MMQDKTGSVIILRTLSVMLLVVVAGMIGAALIFGLEIPMALVIGLTILAIANLVIAQKNSRDTGTNA